MTVTTDIENENKADVVVAKVLDNNDVESEPAVATIAASVYESPEATEKTAAVKAATVVPLELANAVDAEDKRRSELFCGSCCDYLKAVVVVNIIFFVVSGFSTLAMISGFALVNNMAAEDFDDDVMAGDFEEMKDSFNGWMALYFTRLALSLLFGILGIVGAAKYNKCLVLSTGVWYFLDCVFSIVFMDFLGCALRVFFAYPHFGLYLALKKGNITPERYEVEKYCCCDGKQPR